MARARLRQREFLKTLAMMQAEPELARRHNKCMKTQFIGRRFKKCIGWRRLMDHDSAYKSRLAFQYRAKIGAYSVYHIA